jgi:general secretion pathway protein J
MSFNFPNKKRPANTAGFTMLEVLIAIALLGMISLGIYQATAETYRLRDILLNEGDFYNGIRLSLSVMDRDISLLYSPYIMKPEEPVTAPSARPITLSTAADATTFWGPATDDGGIKPSRFIGTDTKISFVSASHIRLYKDAPESEFALISYELVQDRTSGLPDSMVLLKNESSNVFIEDERTDKLKKTYPLLHGIKKWRYRYYRKDKDRWENSWDSDKEDFKNIYPDIIEVTVEVIGPSRLHFEGMYKFRPETPLNGLNPST